MKKIDIFERLGLSNTEAKIYTSMLGNEALTVAEIAKNSGLYRPMIYKLLPRLIEKNLISKSQKGKRSVFIAEPPESLRNLIEKTRDEVEQVIPDLRNKYLTSKDRPIIRYFEGPEGIKFIYRDLIENCQKGDVIYRYESPKDYKRNKKYYPSLYFFKTTGKESVIQRFVITNERTHNLRRPQLDRYSKPVPSKIDLFEYDITQLIYKNKVAFIDYANEIASLIESASFARFQQQIFKLLFEKL